jgi:hypothetical protein
VLVGALWPDGSATAEPVAVTCRAARLDWMANVSDDRRLSDLSIPGTHDTMAWQVDPDADYVDDPVIGDAVRDFTLCQSFPLADQLEYGCRSLDIRCRHVREGGADRFVMHHGPIHLGTTFGYVLDRVGEFLRDHPTEFVLLWVQEEFDADPDVEQSFEETFRDYVDAYPGLFWDLGSESLPTLGEARGTVVLVRNFPVSPGAVLGFPAGGTASQRVVDLSEYQLDCSYPDRSCIDEKISEVRHLLDRVDADRARDELFFIGMNATSFEGDFDTVSETFLHDGWFPLFVSAEVTPPIHFDFAGLVDFLGNPVPGPRSDTRRTGVLSMDFVDRRLVLQVLRCNFRKGGERAR